MIVCICNNVSDRKIRQAVDAGMTSMVELRDHLDIGTCCGKCHPSAKRVLRDCLACKAENAPAPLHAGQQRVKRCQMQQDDGAQWKQARARGGL